MRRIFYTRVWKSLVIVPSSITQISKQEQITQDTSCKVQSFLIPGTVIEIFKDSVVAVVHVTSTIQLVCVGTMCVPIHNIPTGFMTEVSHIYTIQ